MLEELRWFTPIVSIFLKNYEVRASAEQEKWGWELEVRGIGEGLKELSQRAGVLNK